MWRQPEWQKPGMLRHFGWQGLLYDWIYDAMKPEERLKFGTLLGTWVGTWWQTAEVNIDREGWWYNQHWGPGHLDVPHNRVALTSKLFMSLASSGNAGEFEPAVQTNLKSFYEKFLADGLPALDQMGGVWSESNGHGDYGPLLVVPLSYQAVKTGMAFDPFAKTTQRGFAREYIRAGIYSTMPHNFKLAYIDDCSSGFARQHARCAPLFARHYRDGVARWLSDTALEQGWLMNRRIQKNEVWTRIAFLPADVKPVSPKQAGWPLAYHFRGAGHNDGCYYSGGSLIYNIVTVYHPDEKMRRSNYNENDGGLLRYVYDHGFPKERGHITAYWHDERLATYAAADLTQGYWSEKVKEVSRQFLYLRGAQECFVIFDRVESTNAEYPKVWFLHLPSEPSVTGTAGVKVDGHVTQYDGDTCTWLSGEAGDTGMLSSGNSRIIMQTLAPTPGRITKRGGEGHDFWGHPYNPKAQYNHTLDLNGKEDKTYRRPPFSPWRLEVEPPARQTRDYFLHVLRLTDEGVKELEPAKLIDEQGRLGARFSLGPRAVTVTFNTTGPLGGKLTIAEGRKTLHDAALPDTLG
jgi:hypothetical protein